MCRHASATLWMAASCLSSPPNLSIIERTAWTPATAWIGSAMVSGGKLARARHRKGRSGHKITRLVTSLEAIKCSIDDMRGVGLFDEAHTLLDARLKADEVHHRAFSRFSDEAPQQYEPLCQRS